jgi:hypothetical protein
MEERDFRVPGFPVLLLVIFGAVGLFVLANRPGQDQPGPLPGIIVVFGSVVLLLEFTGFLRVFTGFLDRQPQPGSGDPVLRSGTINRPGLQWTVPMSIKRHVSLRVRNFETAKLKEG